MDDRDERKSWVDLVLVMAAGEPGIYVCESMDAARDKAVRIEAVKQDWIRMDKPDLNGVRMHFPKGYLTRIEFRPHKEPATVTTIAAAPAAPEAEPAAKPEPKPAGPRVIAATAIGPGGVESAISPGGNGAGTAPIPVPAAAADEGDEANAEA